MSSTVHPCAYCGNVNFHYLPNMTMHVGHWTSVMGLQANIVNLGERWNFTLVVCTQCGLTQTFTTNAVGLAGRVPGASTVSATTR